MAAYWDLFDCTIRQVFGFFNIYFYEFKNVYFFILYINENYGFLLQSKEVVFNSHTFYFAHLLQNK